MFSWGYILFLNLKYIPLSSNSLIPFVYFYVLGESIMFPDLIVMAFYRRCPMRPSNMLLCGHQSYILWWLSLCGLCMSFFLAEMTTMDTQRGQAGSLEGKAGFLLVGHADQQSLWLMLAYWLVRLCPRTTMWMTQEESGLVLAQWLVGLDPHVAVCMPWGGSGLAPSHWGLEPGFFVEICVVCNGLALVIASW